MHNFLKFFFVVSACEKLCIKYPFQLGDVLVIEFQGVFFQTKLNSNVWNNRVKLMPENGVGAE